MRSMAIIDRFITPCDHLADIVEGWEYENMHVLNSRRILRAGIVLTAVLPAVMLCQGASMASSRVIKPVENLIKDPGAEKAKPSSAGGVVTVPDWTTSASSGFTAVRYGTAGGFPGPGEHLPAHKGKNFFAGGAVTSAVSAGSQIDSLTAYKKLIKKGARFTLSAWLGGFSTQTDHATLTVTWLSGADKVLGHKTIGPVNEAQRHGNTGLWFRSASGKVPAGARLALITLRLVRKQGSYNDGYADNLSLTLVSAKK
jgi:hypothetical protein